MSISFLHDNVMQQAVIAILAPSGTIPPFARRLAAPKSPPARRFRFQDIGQNFEPPAKRRFDFGNADAMPVRKFSKERIIDEMPAKYRLVPRRH